MSLVTFDPKEEAKLRRKIDYCIVPTVALLYLFCFIDRANIGSASSPSEPLVVSAADVRLQTPDLPASRKT